MNTTKAIATLTTGIRAVTELTTRPRYRKALRALGSKSEATVSDVYYAAQNLHLNDAKLLRLALEALPA